MSIRISQRSIFVIVLLAFAAVGVIGFCLSPEQFGLMSFIKGVGSSSSAVADRGHREVNEIYIRVGDESLRLVLSDNSAARELAGKLVYDDLDIEMEDSRSGKLGTLNFSLPVETESIVMKPGDVVLQQDNQLAIYYDTYTSTSTQIGHIEGATQGKLKSLLSGDTVTITLSIFE